MLKNIIIVVLIVGLRLITLPHPCSADYVPPDQVHIQTEDYSVSDFHLIEGKYRYDIAWQGIPVASAVVDVSLKPHGEQNGQVYRIAVSAKTSSIIEIFYYLRFSAVSEFTTPSLTPIRYESRTRENSRQKEQIIEFQKNGSVRASASKNGVTKEVISFVPNNTIRDPISASFLARLLSFNSEKPIELDVFNGKHRYLITFNLDSIEQVKAAGRYFQAYKLRPEVQRLTDTNPGTQLKSAYIWVSADEQRHLLKLESEVWIGSVSATLSNFERKFESSSPNRQK